MLSDKDGVVRWMPGVLRCMETLYAPLSLITVSAYLESPISMNIGEYGVERVQIGELIVPTDELGRILINYRGAGKTFPHIPVTDILNNNIADTVVKDKIVIVGATAVGIYDLRVTPFGTVFPGVEIHANVVDSILSEDFMYQPAWAAIFDIMAIIVAGLILGFVLPKTGVISGAAAGFSLFIGYMLLCQYLFSQKGLILNLVYPLTVTSYFAYANPSFSRGRSIFTKTIFHAKSKRKGYNEWLHPDVVGVYLPLDDWKQEVIVFNQLLDNNSIRLFSFELKKSITKANYRESYFQAVSNSSWAHEGYLVAADITQDDDLLSELERLSVSFGIGVIHLRLRDFDSSMVLFPAHTRVTLDWETVNKLCDQNKDFEKFIQDVRIDFDSKRFHSSEYDPILRDPIKYIKDKLKIEQED